MTHDVRGGLRVSPRRFELGLAATLLGELALIGHVRIIDDAVVPTVLSQPLAGPVLTRVMTGMWAEPDPLDVSTWLTFLSSPEHAPTWIRDGMRQAKLLVPVETFSAWSGRRPYRLRLWQKGERLEPRNTSTANLPGALMAMWASGRDRRDLPERAAFLWGVLSATGLAGTVASDLPPHRDRYLKMRVATLPDSPARVLAALQDARPTRPTLGRASAVPGPRYGRSGGGHWTTSSVSGLTGAWPR